MTGRSTEEPVTEHSQDCQEGVAYLLALVVLSLLTMLGIGLHLVVQTDGEAVAAMRETVRSDFQVRSGIALAVSRALA